MMLKNVNKMKIVYSDPKTGRSAQAVLEGERTSALLNYKINDVIDGSVIGLAGCKLKITGGSDKSGFPLTKGIGGSIKTSALKKLSGPGGKGLYRRFTVRGSVISVDTEQVNTIIVEYGSTPASEIFPEKAKPAAAEAEAAK